ncbi:MAG: TetR/AcrR family transcriptional regulator [Weissella hellenica]|uniref:TetR/AcrR family transcriptional regulator n=1 Tax=Weissella hellenica TaxID=46256 RepID=UPI003885AA67
MSNDNHVQETILKAFSDLIRQYGYRGTTTKKIAAVANVNESTVFRHFKNKAGILKALIQNYLFDVKQAANDFEFHDDIETDLVQAASIYQQFIKQHQSIFLLSLHESAEFPEIESVINQLPQYFHDLLMDKFREMMQAGEISSEIDIATEVDSFVTLCFGNAVASFVYPNSALFVKSEQFLENNIRTFAKHLK